MRRITEHPPGLTARQAFALAGVSKSTFYRYQRAQRGPRAVRVGPFVYYPREAVLDWMKSELNKAKA